MGIELGEVVNYVLFTNPVSSNATWYAKSAACAVKDIVNPAKPKKVVEVVKMEPLWKLAAASGPYLRVAALSGAAAVVLGAYGSHRKYTDEKGLEHKNAFETASRYHFFHTLALIALPMCRNPFLVATFMVSGMLMFCGSCYYYAFTGDRSFSKITPFGGLCLIAGWLCMIF